VATLDVLSGGRVLLGIGVGWNAEELANHRSNVPFSKRYSAMRERVEALRRTWTEEEPAYQGRYESFSPSWVYPIPVRRPVPIALGIAGRVGIRHAAEYADHWCPIDAQLLNYDGRPDVAGGIELFRTLATEAGRDASAIPISIFAFGRPRQDRLEVYARLGVERIVVPPPRMSRHDADATLHWLDEWSPVMGQLAAV
jgi:alkanesulfonate monooxygenase SsuD/methylene tetrahydromethanopterin reductase-like flavin-dependent oxidoreductase (luciferase family)